VKLEGVAHTFVNARCGPPQHLSVRLIGWYRTLGLNHLSTQLPLRGQCWLYSYASVVAHHLPIYLTPNFLLSAPIKAVTIWEVFAGCQSIPKIVSN